MEINKIIENLELMKAEVEWEYPIDYAATIDEVIELIKERKVGHWVQCSGYISCSVCSCVSSRNEDGEMEETAFCPACGAIMYEVDNGN